MRISRLGRIVAVLAALAGQAMLAACGGSDSSEPGGSDTGEGGESPGDDVSTDSVGGDDTIGGDDTASSSDASDPFSDIITELPLSIAVDNTIEPQTETWPALVEGGEPRPVAGISGHGGRVSSFVADELIFTYTNDTELDAFVARWSGEVILEIDPPSTGLTDMPKMALVRVDASSANIDDFIPSVRELEPLASGDFAVSSEAALKLLTAAVTENAAGGVVGVNWIGESSAILDRNVQESETSMSISSYDPNPFTWNHMRAGSVQNIGVTEAWRALALEGKLGNKVKIAVIDGGFAPDDDFPAVYTAESVLFWKTPTNSTNPTNCSGGTPCNYHGTGVLHTAAAQVDNGFGTAGTGGPVAEGISVVAIPDSITSTMALLKARDLGAQIINMSFSMTVPSILGGTIAPQEIATRSLAKKGILLFAAAGNSGENVDAEECFSFCIPFTDYCWKDCFETYWHAPCENDGVVCIGGLGMNVRTRATNSNFGKEHVHLFAPYTVFVGANPENNDPIRSASGTSYSSPYVAGVAALVMAADPSLSAEKIAEILMNTGHPSVDPQVPRSINALGAVQAALGNVRPTIRILAPADGSTFGAVGIDGITLIATTEDYEDGVDAVTVTWDAKPDGPLGTGHIRDVYFTTPGFRTITATATDSGGRTSSASIQIDFINEPPSLSITGPVFPDTVVVGVPFTVFANTWDPEAFSSLPCSSITWEFQKANAPTWEDIGTGCSMNVTVPTAEFYSVRTIAKDSAGAEATKVSQFKGTPLPATGPPYVSIIAPVAGANVDPWALLTLVGTAIDPDDPEGIAPLKYEWTGKQSGGQSFLIGSSPIVTWKPGDDIGNVCGQKSVEITLTVTDTGGQMSNKKITISVYYPPC